MKSIVEYLISKDYDEHDISPALVSREEIEEKCPKFWSAVSQFCRDYNSEKGVDWIIAAWASKDQKEWAEYEKKWQKYYRMDEPFHASEYDDFEENYLTDEACEEIEEFKKHN